MGYTCQEYLTDDDRQIGDAHDIKGKGRTMRNQERFSPFALRLALIVGLLASGSMGPVEAQGSWVSRADMPTGRWELSTCVVDGLIYAIGGASPVYEASPAVEVYDPVTDTWSAKSAMPTARQGLSTNVVDGKIYAFGGYGSSSIVAEYDPVTDTWTEKANEQTQRTALSTSVVGGRIYCIGGYPTGVSYLGLVTVDIYDPQTDTLDNSTRHAHRKIRSPYQRGGRENLHHWRDGQVD